MQLRKWKQSQRALQKDKRSVITTICCSCLSFYYQNHKFLSEKLEGKKKTTLVFEFLYAELSAKKQDLFFFSSFTCVVYFVLQLFLATLAKASLSENLFFFFFLSIFIQQTKPTVYIGVVSFSIFLIEKTICMANEVFVKFGQFVFRK